VHVLSVIRAQETYENKAEGMKGSLEQINEVLTNPFVNIQGEMYEIELFLYKVK